uniref:Uncharacterized protein n=1 Tax=Anguilla anguilla TaxID=7936 RepID=A0A0E9QAY6_ANGAN
MNYLLDMTETFVTLDRLEQSVRIELLNWAMPQNRISILPQH